MAETETDNTDQNQRRNTVRGMTPEQVSVLKQGGAAAKGIYWDFFLRFEDSIKSYVEKDRASKRRNGHKVLSDVDIQMVTEKVMDDLLKMAIKGDLYKALDGGEPDQSVEVVRKIIKNRISDRQRSLSFKRTSTVTIGTGSGDEDGESEFNPESPRQHSVEESLDYVLVADRTFPFPFAETGLKNREHKLFTVIQWERIEWGSAQEKALAITELSEWLGISESEVEKRIQIAHKNEEIRRIRQSEELSEKMGTLISNVRGAPKKEEKISNQDLELNRERVLCPLDKNALGSIFAECPNSNTLDRYMKAYRDFRDQDGFLNELLRQDSDDLSYD